MPSCSLVLQWAGGRRGRMHSRESLRERNREKSSHSRILQHRQAAGRLHIPNVQSSAGPWMLPASKSQKGVRNWQDFSRFVELTRWHQEACTFGCLTLREGLGA